MKHDFCTIATTIERDGVEYAIEVPIEHLFKGSPGCISGRPENCYPPEPPECELGDAWLVSDTGARLRTIVLRESERCEVEALVWKQVEKEEIDAAEEHASMLDDWE